MGRRGETPKLGSDLDLPTDVLGDGARVVGAQATPLGRLSGGVNAGAWRLQLGGGPMQC